jgi:hypothetical protein
MINRIKIKQIDTQCYVASLTGGCIIASDQLTTTSLFLKAVIKVYVNCEYQEEFEDTKGVIIIRISKTNRQRKGQQKKGQKGKQRSTKHTYKTKDRVTRTQNMTIHSCHNI